MPLLCSQLEPVPCLGIVLRNAFPIDMHEADHVLAIGITFLCCQFEPVLCLIVILGAKMLYTTRKHLFSIILELCSICTGFNNSSFLFSEFILPLATGIFPFATEYGAGS